MPVCLGYEAHGLPFPALPTYGKQEAPWISTGRRPRRQGQPSPSLRLLCGKQWKEAKGRERLPGRKHLAACLSQDREQLPAPRRTDSIVPALLLPPALPAAWLLNSCPLRHLRFSSSPTASRFSGGNACPSTSRPHTSDQAASTDPDSVRKTGKSHLLSQLTKLPCPKLSLCSFVPALVVITIWMQGWFFGITLLIFRLHFTIIRVLFNGASKL